MKTEKERQLDDGREGGEGWARSRIKRPQEESLILYKSLNALWVLLTLSILCVRPRPWYREDFRTTELAI